MVLSPLLVGLCGNGAISACVSGLQAASPRSGWNWSQKLGGGGENCTPDYLLCEQTPCCLGYAAFENAMPLASQLSTRNEARLVAIVSQPTPHNGCGYGFHRLDELLLGYGWAVMLAMMVVLGDAKGLGDR